MSRRVGFIAAAALVALLVCLPALAGDEGHADGHPPPLDRPEVTIAFALAAGILAQSVGRHAGIPGIVFLLATGVLFGPSGLNLIRPSTLLPEMILDPATGVTRAVGTDLLRLLVGFAVAVILFEGGLNLDIKRLRREQKSIQMLVTVGALVTAVGGTLAAKLIMGWGWQSSILFGTLVIVTGPTVITPLLRRLQVKQSVSTVLEAEGVLIDAVGAVVAAVTFEVIVAPELHLAGGLGVFGVLGFGLGAGAIGGIVLALLLRHRDIVPEGIENVFTLALVLALYQATNSMMEESGIAAVTMAGIVVGNSKTVVRRELVEFKEQLTVMLIGLLFVLLAADVRMDDVRALGWRGAATVAALMLVVRPANVLAGTAFSGLGWKEKAFISWIGPRGIVAAAVASLFASKLGGEAGAQLRALVFLVIAVTVLSAGLLGGPIAAALGLRRKKDFGWVILGAHPLARSLGFALKRSGQEVVCIDTNHDSVNKAGSVGLKVIWGNGLEERILERAQVPIRMGAIGLTANDELNQLFGQKVREMAKLKRVLVAVQATADRITAEMLEGSGAELLFGRPEDVELWEVRLRRNVADVQRWRFTGEPAEDAGEDGILAPGTSGLFLALTHDRGETVEPMSASVKPRKDDVVRFAVNTERIDEVKEILGRHGWVSLEDEEEDDEPDEKAGDA